MSADEIEAYARSVGLDVSAIVGSDNKSYTVFTGYTIVNGPLAGNKCDVAFERVNTVPYCFPAAIHTRPAMVAMNMQNGLRTQASNIGPEWQYWSRLLRHEQTPRNVVAHIASIFRDLKDIL
jgi:hypothetical protein